MKSSFISCTIVACLFILQGCSIQKMRYSRGFNISFERFAKERQNEKTNPAGNREKVISSIVVAEESDAKPETAIIESPQVSPGPDSIPVTIQITAEKGTKLSKPLESGPVVHANLSGAQSEGWNDFVSVSLAFVLMSIGTLFIISSTQILSFFYVTLALALLAVIFAVIGLLGIREGRGTGTVAATIVIILGILLAFFSAMFFNAI